MVAEADYDQQTQSNFSYRKYSSYWVASLCYDWFLLAFLES
jgi:hypothetical protein